MRVVLAAVGSRGDTVPFGALAARLCRDGHDVVMLAHAPLVGSIPSEVPVVPVDSDPGALLAGPAGAAVRQGDPRSLNRARGLFAEFLASFAAPTSQMIEGADVLVASTFAIAPTDVAIRRGVPVLRAHLWPESPDLDGPMPVLPYGWTLPPPLRRAARWGLRRMEGYLAGFDGWWERGRLQIHPHHPVGLTTHTLGTMYAVSPRLVPDGGLAGRVTGWWVPPRDASMSPEVTRRLDTPGPWVYVGFGSMHQARPERLAADISWAARVAGVRILLRLPGLDVPPGTTDGTVVVVGHEPHDLLFPRLDLVVHHGGSGTTGAAVRAGVPSVVVPHFADQYDWGHRLHVAGVAPPPLPRALLTRRRLARLLTAGLSPRLRTRAAGLAREVRQEDGTGVAARYVHDLVRSGTGT